MNFKKYFPLTLIVLLFGCFSYPPIWVDERPNDSKYWHGIGFAKHSESNSPKMLAKEYAIHEVSSQIKINISSELDILTSDMNGSIENVITSVMNSRVSLFLPELEFVELPYDHPIYNIHYEIKNGLPKIHEHNNENPKGLGLIYEGRLVCFYDFECDLGDGWEDKEVHNDSDETRKKALEMGANIIKLALTNQESF